MIAGARRRRQDDGSVTLFFVIAVTGLLLLVGLVVDGGAKVRALEHADQVAAEAGRAGGQAINVAAAITGDTPTVDAVAASRGYLAADGVTGTVTVSNGGRSLTVDVTTSTPTVFLGMIGVDRMTVHGTATVSLIRSVTGASS